MQNENVTVRSGIRALKIFAALTVIFWDNISLTVQIGNPTELRCISNLYQIGVKYLFNIGGLLYFRTRRQDFRSKVRLRKESSLSYQRETCQKNSTGKLLGAAAVHGCIYIMYNPTVSLYIHLYYMYCLYVYIICTVTVGLWILTFGALTGTFFHHGILKQFLCETLEYRYTICYNVDLPKKYED